MSRKPETSLHHKFGRIIVGVYESVNQVHFNEVSAHKKHVSQPHCKAFAAFSSEISKVRVDFESG